MLYNLFESSEQWLDDIDFRLMEIEMEEERRRREAEEQEKLEEEYPCPQ